jgi:1,4-alpha-glucan branching enzyme
MWTHPGKKLLFMGGELAQEREWNHDSSLDWHLLADPLHRGVQLVVRDLNGLYRELAVLHELDCEAGGFQWIEAGDAAQSTLAYIRRGRDPHELAVIVANFTPVPRHDYRVGVPQGGLYRERFNSDAVEYGGSGLGNAGAVVAEAHAAHGQAHSLVLTLPPLATLVFTREPGSG